MNYFLTWEVVLDGRRRWSNDWRWRWWPSWAGRRFFQGSVLAPLKWNLFLDPLLHLMEDTSDPYIKGSGPSAIHLRILAFADDTTIFASSHRGYIERMELAGKYFGIFGVNFSPAKTHYTYANTRGRHYQSAPITVRKIRWYYINTTFFSHFTTQATALSWSMVVAYAKLAPGQTKTQRRSIQNINNP
jgi:hypothetical protein